MRVNCGGGVLSPHPSLALLVGVLLGLCYLGSRSKKVFTTMPLVARIAAMASRNSVDLTQWSLIPPSMAEFRLQ